MNLRLGVVTCQPGLAAAAVRLAADRASGRLPVDIFFNGCEPSGSFHRALTSTENVGQTLGMHGLWKEYGEHEPDDLLALIHDDLLILEQGWDDQVRQAFSDPDVLQVGFAGARSIVMKGAQMMRRDFVCAMTDAEKHGDRATAPTRVAMLDDLAIVFRMSFLDDLGGFDWWPYPTHWQAFALGLEVARRGKSTWMVPVHCVHLGYQTSKTAAYDALAQKYGGKDEVLAGGHRKLCADYGRLLPLSV
jgi:hypothetical protein